MSKVYNKYAAMFAEVSKLYQTSLVIVEACNWRDYDRASGLTEKAWIAYVEEAFAQLGITESWVDMGKIMNIALMPDYEPEAYTTTAVQPPASPDIIPSPGITVREIDNADGKFHLSQPVRVDC